MIIKILFGVLTWWHLTGDGGQDTEDQEGEHEGCALVVILRVRAHSTTVHYNKLRSAANVVITQIRTKYY